MKNNTGKMAELLGRLKVEMNGAVSASMRERGIVYPLNYGVSIPTIRAVAAEYAPDHPLAQLLYRQEIRELKLAALTIADPGAITAGELDFWTSGVVNTEIAEHLASTLLGHSKAAVEAAERWLSSGNDLLRYTALLTWTKALSIAKSGNALPGNIGHIFDSLGDCLQSENRFVWQGLAALLGRMASAIPESRAQIGALLDHTKAQGLPCAQHLTDELGWQIE